MKKKTNVFLAALMCAALLAGCGGSDTGSGSGSSKDASEDKPSAAKADYSMEETVVADNDYYTITALGAEAGEDGECIMEFEFTNKTGYDLALDISSYNSYINRCYLAFGYVHWDEEESDICYADENSTYAGMIEAAGDDTDFPIGIGAPAGGSGTGKCIFPLPDGVSAAEELIFTPEIKPQHSDEDPSEPNATNPIAYEEIQAMNPEQEYTVYPTGLTADTVEFPSYEPGEGEQVVAETEQFIYVIGDLEEDEDGNFTLHTYFENRSAEPLSYNWDNISVNGYTSEDMYVNDAAHDLPAGRHIQGELSFRPDAKKTYGLAEGEALEELSFTLHVLHWVEADGYGSYQDLYNDMFTCSFGK